MYSKFLNNISITLFRHNLYRYYTDVRAGYEVTYSSQQPCLSSAKHFAAHSNFSSAVGTVASPLKPISAHLGIIINQQISKIISALVNYYIDLSLIFAHSLKNPQFDGWLLKHLARPLFTEPFSSQLKSNYRIFHIFQCEVNLGRL